jgi:hypothetical protein
MYIRDTPETPYNYIELHDTEYNPIPNSDEGVWAKLRRIHWHATAQEFKYAMGNTWEGVWRKLIWLRREFFIYQPISFAIAVLLAAAGAYVTLRKNRPAFLFLLGMIISSIIFLCAYRMWGQAADYMSLWWAVIVFLGVATALAIPSGRRFSEVTGWIALLAMIFFTFADAPERPLNTLSPDASEYIAALDMPTLPRNALICVAWPETPVIFYTNYHLTRRPDIEILAAAKTNWERMLERYSHRPILGASMNAEMTRYETIPYRNIWRLRKKDPD